VRVGAEAVEILRAGPIGAEALGQAAGLPVRPAVS